MEAENLFFDSIVVSLPCELLKESLKAKDGVIENWTGASSNSNEKCDIVTVFKKRENVIQFTINDTNIVCTKRSIQINVCKVQKNKPNSEESEILPCDVADVGVKSSPDVISEQTEPEVIKPKKRGRKPKSKTAVSEIVTHESHNQNETGQKRYGLRGVKVSSVIMAAVKGRIDDDENSEEDEFEEKMTDLLDEDFEIPESMLDHDSVSESNDVSQEQTLEGNSEDQSGQLLNVNKTGKKRSIRTSLKRLRKFREILLHKNNGAERKKILASIGNVYSLQRRRKNVTKSAWCKYCQKGFCDHTGLDIHVKKYHMKETGVKEYLDELIPLKKVTCLECNVTFPSRTQLQTHEDQAHSRTISQCSVCGKVFKNLLFLRNHLKQTHLNEETHTCPICSSKFKHANTLKQHIEEVHESKRNARCKDCGKMFYRQSQLNRHARIHNRDEKSIVCQMCGKGFNFEFNLQRHISMVHAPKSEKFHCSYCGKGFKQKVTMFAHIQKVHLNICPFVCELCKARFMRSKQIEDHMAQVHDVTGFKVANPHQQKNKYNRSSDDLFNCLYCEENFYFKSQLIEHVQTTHRDVFPHQCEHCHCGFLEKIFLLRHLDKAHDVLPETWSADDQSLFQDCSQNESRIVPQMTVVTLPEPGAEVNVGSVVSGNGALGLVALDSDSPEDGQSIVGHDDISSAASVLVEISNEDNSNTIHYVIQGGENLNLSSSDTVVHDIASLLLAAEQSLQEDSGTITLETVDEMEKTGDEAVSDSPGVVAIANQNSQTVVTDAVSHTGEVTLIME